MESALAVAGLCTTPTLLYTLAIFKIFNELNYFKGRRYQNWYI